MINLSENDDIISYLSWCDANDISPFDKETNTYNDMYELNTNNKEKEKTKNKKNNRGHYG